MSGSAKDTTICVALGAEGPRTLGKPPFKGLTEEVSRSIGFELELRHLVFNVSCRECARESPSDLAQVPPE